MNSHPAPPANEPARRWEQADTDRTLRAARRHVPLSAVFELTPLCNLSCGMCYVRLDRDEMEAIGRPLDTGEWLRLARETAALGTLNLLLTGGEPMMRPDFCELYHALAHMGFLITLNTNATMMTPPVAALLARCPPTAVDVTLYGASAETYGRVCGDAAAFHKALEGLEILAGLPTRLQVRATFVRGNRREYEAIHALADRFTASFAINPFITRPVRGARRAVDGVRLSPEEMFALEDQGVAYYRQRGGNRRLSRAQLLGPDRLERERRAFDALNAIPPTTLQCTAAKAMYAISWDGKMLPCLNFASPYTLPLQEGLGAAWKRLPGLCGAIPLSGECAACAHAAYCQNCPGYLQAETGRTDRPAPYICGISQWKQKRMTDRDARSVRSQKGADL